MTTTETVVPGSAEHPARPAVTGPVDPLGADILGLLRSLKLSGMKDTLPERLSLARSRQMSHATFLELLLSDEVSRRDARSAAVRAMQAGLAPLLRLDTWNEHDNLVYDRALLADLTSLRFTEAGHNVLILGPVVITGWDGIWPRSCWSRRCCDRCNVGRVVSGAIPASG